MTRRFSTSTGYTMTRLEGSAQSDANAQGAANAQSDANAQDERQDAMARAAGLPAARVIVASMVRRSGLGQAERDALETELAPILRATAAGSLRVDYVSQGRGESVYLVLDECPRDHDLGAQLDPLRAKLPAERWPEVLRSLGVLVALGRSVYAWFAHNHADVVERLTGRRYDLLQVDPANTTLYADAEWPERVGIFVRRGDE